MLGSKYIELCIHKVFYLSLLLSGEVMSDHLPNSV